MKKNRSQLYIASLLGIIISLGVGFFSSIVTREAIPTWYNGLSKPFFSPPNWLFAPVWTLLYTLMGIALGRVWYFGRKHRWGKTALYHFGAQLVFNGLWSLLFFGLKNPLLALIIIFILWVLIQKIVLSIKTHKMKIIIKASKGFFKPKKSSDHRPLKILCLLQAKDF